MSQIVVNPPMGDAMRVVPVGDLDRLEGRLRAALREDAPTEKNYHVRVALQDLRIMEERIELRDSSGGGGDENTAEDVPVE